MDFMSKSKKISAILK